MLHRNRWRLCVAIAATLLEVTRLVGCLESDSDEGGVDSGVESCGQKQISYMGYINRGYSTDEGDWPWHAAVLVNYTGPLEYACGGTIISENLVVTAAHCTFSHALLITADRIKVILGLHNRTGPSEHSNTYGVVEVIRHERFQRSNFHNDIALLKMGEDITYSDYIQPVCLWPVAKDSLSWILENPGFVVGWGQDINGNLPELLQAATLSAVDHEVCRKSRPKHFRKLIPKNNSTFCAGNITQSTNTCAGDSGGGMYYEKNGSWYIRGVVSAGSKAASGQFCDPNQYTTYVDVSYYLNWIAKHQEKVKTRNLLNLGDCGLDTYDINFSEQDKPLFLQYRWMALLEFKNKDSTTAKFTCNGVLIHPRFVLTVGHCASNQKLSSVRLGEYNLLADPDKQLNSNASEVTTFYQSIDVEKVIRHPSFNKPRYDNNIALIKLKHEADTGLPNIQPICLPTLNDYSENYTVTGWKRVGDQSNILQREVDISLEDFDNCHATYSRQFKIKLSSEDHHVCGQRSERDQGHDVDCYHFMPGASLQYVKNVDRKNRYFLTGIFAYGFPGGCRANSTDVFMNVNAYGGWIKKVVEKEGFLV